MKRIIIVAVYTCIISLFCMLTKPVYASNPSGWTIVSEFGKDRLVGISTALFFFFVFAVIPFRYCWNRFFDENKERRLGFRRSAAICFSLAIVTTTAFVLSLGIRQLISPDLSVGYQLKCVRNGQAKLLDEKHREEDFRGVESLDRLRYESIVRLRNALLDYAAAHENVLPETLDLPEFDDCRRVPFASVIRYEYDKSSSAKFLVWEPDILPDSRFAVGRTFNIVDRQEDLP